MLKMILTDFIIEVTIIILQKMEFLLFSIFQERTQIIIYRLTHQIKLNMTYLNLEVN